MDPFGASLAAAGRDHVLDAITLQADATALDIQDVRDCRQHFFIVRGRHGFFVHHHDEIFFCLTLLLAS